VDGQPEGRGTRGRLGTDPATDAVTDCAAVVRAMRTPYLVLTPDLVIADANAAYLATTGRTLAELVGRPVFEAFPGRSGEVGHERAEDITGWICAEGAEGNSDSQEAWRRRALDVQGDLHARALELADARAAEARTAHRLAALARVSLQVSQAETVQELIRVVTEGGLAALGAHGGAVAVPEGDHHLRLVMSEGLRAAAGGGGVLPWDAPYPGCLAARTGERVLLSDRAAAEAFSPVMSEVIASTGAESWAALPLQTAGRRLGSLSVAWTGPRTFAADEMDLLEAFAAQCAQALERIGIRESERVAHAAVEEMAEAFQRSLLTEPPESDGLEVAVRYVPAASLAQVGGDWYDAFPLEDGRMALVIGDVTGHDRYAAAAMAQVRNLLRGIAHSRRDSPAAVLSALDRAMRDLEVGTLATAILATIEQDRDDPAGGARVLRWSNAGHPPPLLIGDDGTVTLLERAPDPLLGVDPDEVRADHEVRWPPGATVLFYTDGLVERRDASLDQGIAWLSRAVARWARSPLEELCDRLLAELSGAVEDDVALLALRAHRDERSRPAGAGRTQAPEGHGAAR
jgi:serine phosphatase RsbU (regulator of sigma subunit)